MPGDIVMGTPAPAADISAAGTEMDRLAALKLGKPSRRNRHLVSAVLVLLLVLAVIDLVQRPAFLWPVFFSYFFAPQVLQGVAVTVELTVMSMVLALALAMVLAVMRLSDNAVLRWLSAGYVAIFRAVPLLVLIILIFNVALLYPTASIGIPFGPQLWSQPTNSLVTAYVAAVIAFGTYQAAYTSEAIRAALLAVPAGQHEAAKALGMPPGLAFRRIIVPQALRIAIPSLGNEAIHLLKGATMVAFISVNDLLNVVQTIYNRTFQVIPLLMVACAWYMLMVAVMSVAQRQLERLTSANAMPADSDAPAPAVPAGPTL